jgi:hypothetical protein
MKRAMFAGLLVLLAIAPALAQQRPSVNSIDAAQKRLTAAVCAKADADGDTYRPFTCDPRCDCLGPLFEAGAPSACEQTQADEFSITFPAATGTCAGGICANSSFQGCGGGGFCPLGEACITSCALNICISTCRLPCSSDSACRGSVARLAGVVAADSPHAVSCVRPTGQFTLETKKINSNDALRCLDQVQAATGPCQ